MSIKKLLKLSRIYISKKLIINIYTCCSYNNHDKTSFFYTFSGMAVVGVLYYSDLRIKQDISIEVVDRYGAPVYKSKD